MTGTNLAPTGAVSKRVRNADLRVVSSSNDVASGRQAEVSDAGFFRTVRKIKAVLPDEIFQDWLQGGLRNAAAFVNPNSALRRAYDAEHATERA